MKLKELADPFPTPVCNIVEYYQLLGEDVRDLKNEDVIDQELAELGPDIAEPEIDDSDKYLKISSGLLRQEIVRIDRIAFVELFKRASKMRLGTISYVTGLKIHFGLVGSEISPVFQPVFMERKIMDSGIYTYDTNFELFYVYNPRTKQFDDAERGDFEKINTYKSSIQIKREVNGNFAPFSSSEDAEGVVFSFQTIFSLLYCNDNDEEVFLYNAIRKENNKMKHCILLATKSKPFLEPVFENKYANRSHLCPPCSSIKYKISAESTISCP